MKPVVNEQNASTVPAPRTRRFRVLNRNNFDARVDAGLFAHNHIFPNASFDGLMFETYGPEVEHVREVAKQHPNRVMTLLDGSRSMMLSHGYHFVNRIGYMVATEDVPFFHDFKI